MSCVALPENYIIASMKSPKVELSWVCMSIVNTTFFTVFWYVIYMPGKLHTFWIHINLSGFDSRSFTVRFMILPTYGSRLPQTPSLSTVYAEKGPCILKQRKMLRTETGKSSLWNDQNRITRDHLGKGSRNNWDTGKTVIGNNYLK